MVASKSNYKANPVKAIAQCHFSCQCPSETLTTLSSFGRRGSFAAGRSLGHRWDHVERGVRMGRVRTSERVHRTVESLALTPRKDALDTFLLILHLPVPMPLPALREDESYINNGTSNAMRDTGQMRARCTCLAAGNHNKHHPFASSHAV